MNQKSFEDLRDDDIRLSFQALKRAGLRARELARRTGTALVVVRNGQIVHVPPHELDLPQTTTTPTPPKDLA